MFLRITKFVISIMLFGGVCFFAAQTMKPYNEIKREADIYALNQRIPSFTYLTERLDDPKTLDPRRLERYIDYYEKLVALMPDQSAGYGMLGFCYYYAGRKTQATAAFERAVALDPGFFWSYYNLGIILLREGNYEAAVRSMEKARSISPQRTMQAMLDSRVYTQILSASSLSIPLVSQHLSEAYRNAYMITRFKDIYPKVDFQLVIF